MIHKLIKTDNYLLMVDDSEIKEGDLCYDLDGNPGYKNNKFIVQCLRTAIDSYWNKNSKKIIAHLPLNDSPILESVDLLPEFEQEIILTNSQQELLKIGDVTYSDTCTTYYIPYSFIYKDGKWYINKIAKEKYKYTENDIRKTIEMAQETILTDLRFEDREHKFTYEEIIQSLSQPKIPIGFKSQIKYIGFQEEGNIEELKKYTNAQGQTQLVGRYIYQS